MDEGDRLLIEQATLYTFRRILLVKVSIGRSFW